MDHFTISPNDCLILKAIKESKSLREAASRLACDPAGLARRIQAISNQHGLIQKVHNRWQVSQRGLNLIAWVEQSMQSQNQVLLAKSSVRIATTMWFSEEVIVPNLASLKDATGKPTPASIYVPSSGFEMAVIDGSVDFAIVCHPPESPEIEHRQVIEEKWTIIAPKAWQKELKNHSLDPWTVLSQKPFVRHNEMNLDLFLPKSTYKFVESPFSMDHMTGIRSAVCEGLGWSIVPLLLVSRYIQEERLVEVSQPLAIPDRKVCIWWLRNRHEMKRQAPRIFSWVKQSCSI